MRTLRQFINEISNIQTLKAYIFESEDVEDVVIKDVNVQYVGPEKLYIQAPETYSESDIQIYIDDMFLKDMPGDETKAKEFFGTNAEHISDAYFSYDSMEQALGDDQKIDIEWNQRYDSTVSDDDKLLVLCISNIRYAMLFDEFKLLGIKPSDTKYKLIDILNTANSNSTNKYPFEIVLDTNNLEFKQ